MVYRQFRQGLELNGSVTPEIQVALVVQAIAEYAACEWAAPAMSSLMSVLQQAVLDPIFLREQLAKIQLEQDRQEEVINRIAPGIGLPGLFPYHKTDETGEE